VEEAMTDRDRELTGVERAQGADLHPQNESWARISTRSTMIGFVIFLVLAALFYLWVTYVT
jgi:hypothetical protein